MAGDFIWTTYKVNLLTCGTKMMPLCLPVSALPLSVGSMAVTGGLIYNGVWKSSQRLGPFPQLAVAGILGFAVGKASYVRTCRSKFQELGIKEGPGFGPWSRKGHGGPGHRSCHHVCEECKKKAAPTEEVKASS